MKFTMKVKRIFGVVVFLLFVLSSQVSGAYVAPIEQIKGTVEGVLAIMQDEKLAASAQKDERRARIIALIDERFDFAEMSRRALAKNWKARTQEEKIEFQKIFTDLLVYNYIGRVEAYSDEKVEYVKEAFSRKKSDRAKVYTNILKNGHQIPINYSLVRKGDDWFVYDVVIEGVSLIRNYRTEFARILNKKKFPELIKQMQEKNESNEAKREK